MFNQRKLIVSHAPFWHVGSSVRQRNNTIMLATLPAVILGILQYGMPAISVLAFSISTAMLWESLTNRLMKRPDSIGDGSAATIGLLLAMMMPATTPWWIVITGTFLAVVIAKMIFGGLGANPFNPVALSMAILMVSWKDFFDFNEALRTYDLGFTMTHPLATLKAFGPAAVDHYSVGALLMGQQTGGMGTTFALGLIAGGLYLMIRGTIRWEISLSFLGGIILTSLIFYAADPASFASPVFHVLTGYTLIGAFFLATEDATSPVHTIPMVLYGAAGGIMTILIRNIGAYIDGVIFAILLINLINPLLDKIRPKAVGKVV